MVQHGISCPEMVYLYTLVAKSNSIFGKIMQIKFNAFSKRSNDYNIQGKDQKIKYYIKLQINISIQWLLVFFQCAHIGNYNPAGASK